MPPQLKPTTLRTGKTLSTPKPTAHQPMEDPIKATQIQDKDQDPELNDEMIHKQILTETVDILSDEARIRRERDDERATKPYSYPADDPDPLTPPIGKKEFNEHIKNLREYSNAMLSAYQRTKSMKDEVLWQDFITAFRPHTIRTWTRPMLCEWKGLLAQRGMFIDPNRNRAQHEAIIDILYREQHAQGSTPAEKDDGDQPKAKSTEPISPQSTNEAIQETTKANDEESKKAKEQPTMHFTTTKQEPDPSDDGNSTDTDNDEERRKERSQNSRSKNKAQHRKEETSIQPSPSQSEQRALGVSGLMKGIAHMPTFAGRFTDDLEEVIEGFETLADVCEVTDDDTKRKSIPLMLKGTAFRRFAKEKHRFATYQEALDELRSWFSSAERQTRLLREWNTMRLTEALSRADGKSEQDVFREFVDRATAIQQQLHVSYHDDRQLRDMLQISVDIPDIQQALADRQPRTTHQLVERVATRLAHTQKKQSGVYFSKQDGEEAHYSLGQRYGGDARNKPQRFNKWNRRGRGGANAQRSNHFQRRKPPWWMKNVKGCFVCGREGHRANERHDKEEVSRAVRNLKRKNSTPRLTTEDKAFIAALFEESDQSEDDDAEANNAEEDYTSEESEWEREEDGGDVAYIATNDLRDLEMAFSDAAFLHGRNVSSKATENNTTEANIAHEQKREKVRFAGIRMDTCCNRTSIIGRPQYRAYCFEFGTKEAVRPAKGRNVSGIGGGVEGIGLVNIDIPFTELLLIIHIEFLLVDQDVPTLMSMKDMKESGIDISLQNETVLFAGRTQKLQLENYFLKHRWGPSDLSFALYTEDELRRIHKTFGHPSISATERLLKRATGGTLNTQNRRAIEQIATSCRICERNRRAPRRFKLTVGMNEMRFNHTVQVDTMFIHNRPVCHLVDQATHFSAATFLRNQTTKTIWDCISKMWMRVYLGPPDFLSVDQGSSYVSKQMKSNCQAEGITLREAPIENPGSIGVVERYHAPLRAAYEKLRSDLPRENSDEDCLQMAVYAVNNTVGPEGLCPTLLVFGAIPRPIRTKPSPSQIERASAIDAAMQEVEQEQARQRIRFGLNHPTGSKGGEDKNGLRQLPAGSKVLVFRKTTQKWEGPFLFVSEDGDTAIIQTPAGRRIFSGVCVKPYNRTPTSNSNRKSTQQNNGDDNQLAEEGGPHSPQANYTTIKDDKTSKKTNAKPNASGKQDKPDFYKTRKAELQGLINNGTFETANINDIPPNTRIFGSRFIDDLKKIGRRLKQKSRLVAQNYMDEEAAEMGTKAPTIQRFSQRLLIALAASIPETYTATRDITQAYVQSRSRLERPVFIKPPKEMNLPKDTVLRVVRPLYGIPESGLHWYLTYLDHHVGRLGMKQSRADPCFLMKHREDGTIDGVVVLQVDDSLIVGSKQFMKMEEEAASEFQTKPRTYITDNITGFNGIQLRRTANGTITMNAQPKITRLKIPQSEKEFASERAAVQYIGGTCRPDVCANTQLIAPGSEPTTKAEHRTLAKTIKYLAKTAEQGLTFAPLDLESTKVVIISDASFANARGSRSQLGFLIILTDKDGNANVVHYSSARCKRVTRSVMAAELHALILAFDYGFVLREMLKEVLRRDVKLEALIDSKTVFDVVAKDGRTNERRLQIDVHALKESYTRGELTRIGWIPGHRNPADTLTKMTTLDKEKSTPLNDLTQGNKLNLHPIGWAQLTQERTHSTNITTNNTFPTTQTTTESPQGNRQRKPSITPSSNHRSDANADAVADSAYEISQSCDKHGKGEAPKDDENLNNAGTAGALTSPRQPGRQPPNAEASPQQSS